MSKQLVVTVTGRDRPGVVEQVTEIILSQNGNVEASRMARLGGEFAMLFLISAPEPSLGGLEEAFKKLIAAGYAVQTRATEADGGERYQDHHPFTLKVSGADHLGIVHQVSRYLARRGINIEDLDTDVVLAPMSGAPLFTMEATIYVPASVERAALEQALAEVGQQLAVDVELEPLQA